MQTELFVLQMKAENVPIKFQRLYQAILALQQLEKQEIISKMAVFLNRFQSSVRPAKYGNEVEVCGIRSEI